MPGFSIDKGGSGQQVVYADNVDFTGNGSNNVEARVTTNGQLLIGSTSAPHIQVNTLTAGTGISITNGPGTINIEANSQIKITTYNTSDSPATWNKDPRTKMIEVYGWAGGGGGGSGRKGTSTAAGGGGAGSAGGCFYFQGPSLVFNSTESVIIGAGGTGGAAQTTDATNGNPGASAGGNTSFGNMLCLGGSVGAGGTTTIASGGSLQFGIVPYGRLQPPSPGTGQNAGGSTNALNWGATASNPQSLGPGAGGGGGGADTVTQRSGGVGSNLINISSTVILAGGTGGLESTGINGGNGNSPTTGGIITGGSGGGGGGGYSVGAGGATAGGNGGNGAIPGGGGGGGGGGIDLVANSGAGGNGANGRVIVIEYF